MKHFLIETPARIHLGFLELDPNANRNFGSIGLTISNFKTIISLKESKKLIINSRDEDKIEKIIKKLIKIYRFPEFEISILESIPMHTGLGSGTQLALSLGMILAKFFNKNWRTPTSGTKLASASSAVDLEVNVCASKCKSPSMILENFSPTSYAFGAMSATMSLYTRSGCCNANVMAVFPPIECPKTIALSKLYESI